uniref:Ig-like domain-containing protein n=1 Tax=Acanthochromis polyacanthus TaxID=80966 RepID=A0A3Q1FGD5_9TELE
SGREDHTGAPLLFQMLCCRKISSPKFSMCSTCTLAAVPRSKVELSCPLLSSGNPKVQWILPDGSRLIPPSSSPDGRLRASASGLLLQRVRLSDAGIYYCVAWAGKDVDVLPLHLAVEGSSVPPSGEEVEPPFMGTVEDPISLPCMVSGSPEPYMSWILPDGNLIRQGLAVSGGLTIESNGSLSLPNPSLLDAGHYRCIAVNQYGSDSRSVEIEGGAEGERRQGVAINEGTKAVATEKPPPSVNKDKTLAIPGYPSGPFSSNKFSPPSGSLVIQNPTGRDTGFYKCTAKNVIGVDTKTTYLHVI